MRIRNSEGRFVMLLVEFANDVFLSNKVRAHPTLQQLTDAAVAHYAYVNDLFSYPKEVLEEQSNLRNIISLLMGSSAGLSIVTCQREITSQCHVTITTSRRVIMTDPDVAAIVG
jgi:formiminotetrahydrofolate cyclodeaminase